MNNDAIWQAFAETGDPLYYLLYKCAEDGSRRETGKKEEFPPSEG